MKRLDDGGTIPKPLERARRSLLQRNREVFMVAFDATICWPGITCLASSALEQNRVAPLGHQPSAVHTGLPTAQAGQALHQTHLELETQTPNDLQL